MNGTQKRKMDVVPSPAPKKACKDLSLEDMLKVIRLYQELKNKREVARRMDLVESTVTKIVRKKEEIEKLAKDCQKPVDGYVLCNTCTYFA